MSMHGVPNGIVNPPRPFTEADEEAAYAEKGSFGMAPGTLVLALVFLGAFAVYYFTNWKLLSVVWQVG
jgi:hypothetical protein